MDRRKWEHWSEEGRKSWGRLTGDRHFRPCILSMSKGSVMEALEALEAAANTMELMQIEPWPQLIMHGAQPHKNARSTHY